MGCQGGRSVAAILLLYAQPFSRITRLTLDDVIRDGDQALLRLGPTLGSHTGEIAYLTVTGSPSNLVPGPSPVTLGSQ
jgi:hypothetical protein